MYPLASLPALPLAQQAGEALGVVVLIILEKKNKDYLSWS
jgi:hypothetical protein